MANKKLYRSESDRMISGICGGISEVYGYDVSLIRLVTLLIVLVTFPLGLIAYLFGWLVIPTESEM
mgnify:CR=1 FL=1